MWVKSAALTAEECNNSINMGDGGCLICTLFMYAKAVILLLYLLVHTLAVFSVFFYVYLYGRRCRASLHSEASSLPSPFNSLPPPSPFHPLSHSVPVILYAGACVCVCPRPAVACLIYSPRLLYMQHGRVLHKEHTATGKITKHAKATNMCDSRANEMKREIS